jgi:hypothetical protein
VCQSRRYTIFLAHHPRRTVDLAEQVADAERRYAARYEPPRPNPSRVVVEIRVTNVLGNV